MVMVLVEPPHQLSKLLGFVVSLSRHDAAGKQPGLIAVSEVVEPLSDPVTIGHRRLHVDQCRGDDTAVDRKGEG